MNELTKELQEIPVPRAVLVAYKYEDGPYGKRQKYHLELRPVNRDGKMGAAVPVSHEFEHAGGELFSGDERHALRTDPTRIALVRHPQGAREIRLVQSAGKTAHVLHERSEH